MLNTLIRHNAITVSIRPVANIYLDGPPEHSELCCIVWRGDKRLVKYINKACPIHGKVECLVEAAN